MIAWRVVVVSACCVMFAGGVFAQGKEPSLSAAGSSEKAEADRRQAEREKRQQEHERHRAEIEARMRASRNAAMREGRLSPTEMARVERAGTGDGALSGADVRELVSLRKEVSALREEISALRRFLEGQHGAGLARPASAAPRKLGQPMKAK